MGLPATAAKPFTRSTSCAEASAATRSAIVGRIGDFAQRHDEALEIVVVVVELVVVMRHAVLDIVLGADAKTEQHRGIDLALRDGDDTSPRAAVSRNGRKRFLANRRR